MKDTALIKVKYFLTTILYASVVWMLDSVIEYFFFVENNSFWDVVILQISGTEFYHRMIFVGFIFFYGFMHGGDLLRQKQKNIEFRKVTDEFLLNKEKLIKVNEELFNNNTKFISYLENSPYGIIVLYPNNNVYEANSEMGNLMGCSRHDLENLTFGDFIPDFAKKMGVDLLNKVDKEGKGSADLPYITRMNITRFCKIKVVKLDDGNKLCFVIDITKRLEADKNIKESEHRFQTILNDIETVAVQGYDKDREVIYWNKASELLYGYSEKEALGQKLEDLIIPEEMKDGVIKGIKNWHENNQPIPHGELILKGKDGNPVHVYSSHVMINKSNETKEMFCVDLKLGTKKDEAKSYVNLNKG